MPLYLSFGFGDPLNLQTVLILFSSLSFLAYGISYFVSPYMKKEFERFGLSKYADLTIFFEFAGSLGLLAGLVYHPMLLLASGGLTLLMFCGVIVRIKIGDRFKLCFPALFYLVLNGYLFASAWTS